MVMEFAEALTEQVSYFMWLAADFRAIGVQEVTRLLLGCRIFHQ